MATDFCKIGVPETKITGSVITFYEENFLTICTEIITVFPRMQSPQENKTNKGFQKIFYIYFRKENKTHEGFQKKFYFYFRKENKTHEGFLKKFYFYFRKDKKTNKGFQNMFYFYFRKENKTT